MPYRDELEGLKAQLEALTVERDDASARLERARAALASVVAEMAGLPAEADIPWRSLHGGEPTSVRFVNATPRKVELLWVSYDGQPRSELTLVAGGEREVKTYVAHLFRAIDVESGRVVTQRYVRADEPRVVIGETSEDR
jgi:hypothetical protein